MRVLVGFMGRQPLRMVAFRNGEPTPLVHLQTVTCTDNHLTTTSHEELHLALTFFYDSNFQVYLSSLSLPLDCKSEEMSIYTVHQRQKAPKVLCILAL